MLQSLVMKQLGMLQRFAEQRNDSVGQDDWSEHQGICREFCGFELYRTREKIVDTIMINVCTMT
jgi:hypothetical protein